MKRYVSLACIAMVLVMCMVSPVSASEFPSTRINILDICNVPKTSFSGTEDIYFNFDLPMVFDYVDILCQFYVAPDSIQMLRYDYSWITLNVTSIGNGYYRIYGDFPTNDVSNITLRINSSRSNWVDFYSFYVSLSGTTFDSDCYCNISAINYDKTIHFVSSDEVNYRTFTGTEDIYNMGYQLSLYNLSWQKYDFIDYMLYTVVDSISSINVTMGGINVPFEVCYISNDATVANDFIYTIRVDCRGLDRSLDDYPMVEISGNVITGSANMIAVVACNGILDISVDAELTLLQRILKAVSDISPSLTSIINSNFSSLSNWISAQTSSLVSQFDILNANLHSYFSNTYSWINHQTSVLESAIRGDTSPGNSFQQQVDQKDQQLNDMAAVMESVDQPDLNSVNVSANTYVDGTVLAASMSGITSVFSQGLFFDIIVMSIMMATAGYVLFGKR